MFHSAVKSTSPRARFDRESKHVNDFILGQKDAVFLAAFLSSLYRKYEANLPQMSLQETFDKVAFQKSLTEALDEFSTEDQSSFGR